MRGCSGAACVLYLMVAIGAVEMCASGAHADSTVDLVNTCKNDTLVLLYNSTVNDIVIPAGKAVGVDLSFLNGLFGPLYINKNGSLFELTDGLSEILEVTGLYEIELNCDGECGVGYLTVKAYVKVDVGGVEVKTPDTFLCAALVVA